MSQQQSVVRHPLVWIPAPEAPGTPSHLNRVGIRRYARAAAEAADVVLLLSPGFTGGVNDFDTFATALVAAAPGVEVWALERRNHLLEDLGGMEAAEAAGDPEVALQYYLGGGGPPLLRPGEVPCMGGWGLAVALADLRAVVHHARQAVGRAGRVLLGGHSMGGMLAQCYAAWDFEDRPGHTELDGLVLLDGAVGGPQWTATTGMAQFREGEAAVAAGEVFWDDPVRGASPRIGVLAQVAAMAATLPEWRERPSLVAPHAAEWFPLPAGVLLTNEATLGVLLDARTGPISTYRAHIGSLCPSPMAEVEGRPLFGWRSHRESGDPTDLTAVAGVLRQIDGANGLEWYAARRLNAEIDLSSNLDSGDPLTREQAAAAGLRLRHNAAVALPVFAVLAGSGKPVHVGCDWYRGAIAGEVQMLLLPHYDHLDPLFAGPEGNPSVLELAEWIASRRGR
jgi:pimeloyl-ACP methyl ester carboxylesterase